MAGSSGRGPTMAISPRSTLRSCGSSSIFRRRSHAPSGNTRGSSAPVMTLASERRRACMVRSLYMMNGRPPRPTRSARYNTAPGLARRIPTAARASRGAVATNAIAAHTTSTRRLTIADRAADGHEHLRRIETLLVSPGPRAVARSEEHTSELQSPCNLVCRLLLEKKKILHSASLLREDLQGAHREVADPARESSTTQDGDRLANRGDANTAGGELYNLPDEARQDT